MQDRYVGDVGDFAKYALLRTLTQQSELRLGVIWCLFPNESHNADGRHTSYLSDRSFRDLDPFLHGHLKRIVASGNRAISKIEKSRIFPPNTIFVSSPACFVGSNASQSAREAYRTNWLRRALKAASQCDLIFFDPDNGFETPSVAKHSPKGAKYVFMDELNLFWREGHSLIVYHHLNRTAPAKVQTERLRARLKAQFYDASLLMPFLFRRGSCRQFWIIAQAAHAPRLKAGADQMLGSGWSDHFEMC